MNFLDYFDFFPTLFIADFLRYSVAAGIAYFTFWVLFKKRWKHRRIQNKKHTPKKILAEMMYSLSTLIIFAFVGCIIVFLNDKGYTQVYYEWSEGGWLWAICSFILMNLLHDTYFYFTHRLMHHPKLFKHVHLVHHRSVNPSPWAAYCFHPIEAFVEAGIFFLIVFLIPAHPSVLVFFLVYMISRNVLGHLGIELFPKSFFSHAAVNWNTTTTHHDLHHKNFNSNFGLYFTWWDRLLGTEDKKYRETFEEVTSGSENAEI